MGRIAAPQASLYSNCNFVGVTLPDTGWPIIPPACILQRFFCFGHLVAGPNWKSAVGSILLVLAPAVVFNVFVSPYLGRHLSWAIFAIRCAFGCPSLDLPSQAFNFGPPVSSSFILAALARCLAGDWGCAIVTFPAACGSDTSDGVPVYPTFRQAPCDLTCLLQPSPVIYISHNSGKVCDLVVLA